MTYHAWCRLMLSLLALGCSHKPAEPATTADEKASAGAEQRVQCGTIECAVGQVCCNPSCGICAVPDGMCTQQFCDEGEQSTKAGEAPEPAQVSCDNVRCMAGTHCELVQVQCIRAPCNPVPECKADAAKQ